MIKNNSNNLMDCSLCGWKTRGNSNDAVQIICSDCVQMLLHMNQDQIKAYYRKLIKDGSKEKAKLIVNWIQEKEIRNEYKKLGGNSYRKRGSRKIRNSNKRNYRKK